MTKFLLIAGLLFGGDANLLGRDVVEHGLMVSMPPEWLPLELGEDYNGVAGYCDEGQVIFLIERKPFDQKTRMDDFDKRVATEVTEKKSRPLEILLDGE